MAPDSPIPPSPPLNLSSLSVHSPSPPSQAEWKMPWAAVGQRSEQDFYQKYKVTRYRNMRDMVSNQLFLIGTHFLEENGVHSETGAL
jgi:hypothetical protein